MLKQQQIKKQEGIKQPINEVKKEEKKPPVKTALTKPKVQNTKPTLIKIGSSPPKKAIQPKVFIPNLTTIKNYTPIETYLQFVYYTQPVGIEIFYNDSFDTYETCSYENGISVCEKKTVLPTSFTIDSHLQYYGISFNQCDALHK